MWRGGECVYVSYLCYSKHQFQSKIQTQINTDIRAASEKKNIFKVGWTKTDLFI